MVEEYVNYTNREKQYKARAILVVPYMVKEIPSIDKITKTGCWILADADEDDIQQKKVGYLSHAKSILIRITHQKQIFLSVNWLSPVVP